MKVGMSVLTQHLVGLCILEVDGNPIPARRVERWLVQTHKATLAQEISARCSNRKGYLVLCILFVRSDKSI